MKSSLKIVFALFFLLLSQNLFAQDEQLIEEYLERLENSRKYMLEVAELMPEEKYDFKATPESLSFAENLMHIGFAMNWHAKTLIGGKETPNWQEDTQYKTANRTKAEMIEIVNNTFVQSIELIKNIESHLLNERLEYFGHDRTKRQILLLLADHVTHHRGQMLVHLRLNGITPPRYVLFQ